MVSYILPLFRFGIGYALPPGLSYRKNWKERIAWGLITLGATSGWILRPVEARIISGAPWLLRTTWAYGRVAAADAAIMARAAATTQTGGAVGGAATIVAAAALGYTGGAVVGTGIISLAEKEGVVYEGATADVLAFYLGQAEGEYWGDYDWKGQPKSGPKPVFKHGKLVVEEPRPGFFNIPGNVRYIAGWYWNRPYEEKEYRI